VGGKAATKHVRARRHVPVLWLALALLCAMPAPAVYGQESDTDLLAQLNDEDYLVRMDATHRLLADEGLSAEDLDRLFAASETPEQRHRLLRVARHHVIRRMIDQNFGELAGPGSMGLSHHAVRVTGPDGEADRTGVMVVMTLPGFPAYALLEPGDVIVNFAGEPIPERMSPSQQFPNMIRKHQAGDTIELTVMRNGRPKPLRLKLCQGQALTQVYDRDGVTLNEPYRSQWAGERVRLQALTDEPAAAPPAE
jgi:hypothetical protein